MVPQAVEWERGTEYERKELLGSDEKIPYLERGSGGYNEYISQNCLSKKNDFYYL